MTFLQLAALVKRSIFVAPDHDLSDELAIDLAAEHGVRLQISDGDPPPGSFFTGDPPPPTDPPVSPDHPAVPPLPQRQAIHLRSFLDPDTLSPDDDSGSRPDRSGS